MVDMNSFARCACTLTEPCSYACTCANPVMSGGCRRCATYGNASHRRAMARWIATQIPRIGKEQLELFDNETSS